MKNVDFYEGLNLVVLENNELLKEELSNPKMAKISPKIVNGIKNVYSSIDDLSKEDTSLKEDGNNEMLNPSIEEKPQNISEPLVETNKLEEEDQPLINMEDIEKLLTTKIEETNNVETPIEEESVKVLNPSILEDKDSIKDNSSYEDSYVISNFDSLFDNLATDVNESNKFIQELMNKKSSLEKSNKVFGEERESFEKEKSDFEELMKTERAAIEKERTQALEFIEIQKSKIQNDEIQFEAEVEAIKNEINLIQESLNVELEQLQSEKSKFENNKQVEQQSFKNEKSKFEAEKQQFEKEKKLDLEKQNNKQKELDQLRDNFEKYKDIESKKVELDKKNLAQSCSRFKELVAEFNSSVGKLPTE